MKLTLSTLCMTFLFAALPLVSGCESDCDPNKDEPGTECEKVCDMSKDAKGLPCDVEGQTCRYADANCHYDGVCKNGVWEGEKLCTGGSSGGGGL